MTELSSTLDNDATSPASIARLSATGYPAQAFQFEESNDFIHVLIAVDGECAVCWMVSDRDKLAAITQAFKTRLRSRNLTGCCQLRSLTAIQLSQPGVNIDLQGFPEV